MLKKHLIRIKKTYDLRTKQHITFVVLGMHRSGTSLVSNILGDMGVDMGDNMLGANTSNPYGHYEDMTYLALNDKFLKECMGSWDKPPSKKVIDEKLPDFRGRAKKRIESNVKKKYWGWKDPRTVLTLDLYKPYLTNPIYIVVYRNPTDVVASLLERDKNLKKASKDKKNEYFVLLDDYYRRLKNHIREFDGPILKVRYESVSSDPTRFARKLSKITGINYDSKKARNIVKSHNLLKQKQKELANK